MRISKLKVENLYGIEQLELDGKSVELSGSNGMGKSSVLDAIRLALTNNSKRKCVVKNGKNEGRIFVQFDDGTTIDRKKRTDKSDYKSIKDEKGNDINSPENFLKEIFTPLQLEPVEFLSMSEREQNRLLLNLIEFNRDKKEFITEKFGETINWVDYSDSILEILNKIQDKDGEYYLRREEINRKAREGLAIVQDIAKDIPEGYDAEKWRNFTLSDKYEELNKNKEYNAKIEKCIAYKEDYNNKISQLEDKENAVLVEINARKEEEKNNINNKILEMKNQIAILEKELDNIDNKYLLQGTEARNNTIAEKAKLEENIKVANEWAEKSMIITTLLENELKVAEEMKGHLNEYDRMLDKQKEVEQLKLMSESLTNKIELARDLPGEILKEANIPVKNLTVENGIPLVNGLPINGLSEGEKLMLCVDVTLNNPNSLKLILVDGIEKLSDANKNELYKICKDRGLQVVATRTTNDNELIVTEL